MDQPKKVGEYQVIVQQRFQSRWIAIADNGVHTAWAVGPDSEIALRRLADKLGADPCDVLREFGLT